MTESLKEGIHKVVRSVASPLRFFAVSAVCLTVLIAVLAWKSALPAEITSTLIIIAFAALILLLVVVSFLVIFYPKKLVFDQEAHLTVLREKLSDSELTLSYVQGTLPSVEPPAALPPTEGK